MRVCNFIAICWSEHTFPWWSEHALPRGHDTGSRRAGHEEDRSGQEHSDGHEAQSGDRTDPLYISSKSHDFVFMTWIGLLSPGLGLSERTNGRGS